MVASVLSQTFSTLAYTLTMTSEMKLALLPKQFFGIFRQKRLKSRKPYALAEEFLHSREVQKDSFQYQSLQQTVLEEILLSSMKWAGFVGGNIPEVYYYQQVEHLFAFYSSRLCEIKLYRANGITRTVTIFFKQFESARQQTLTAFDSSFIYSFLHLSLSSFSHAVFRFYIYTLLHTMLHFHIYSTLS